MVTWLCSGLLIGVLFTVFRSSSSVAVSDVVCTNGGNECNSIANSACDTTAGVLKCKCATDFDEDLTDGSTCVKVVTATTCTGTDPCSGIDNSVCSSNKCTCNTGYTEKVNTCVKVFGSECSGTDPCQGDANSLCVNDKCACKVGYGQKNNVCTLTVSGTDCTANGNECESIENAFCDEDTDKCSCSPNFIMNVDTCVPENTAASVQVSVIALLLSGVATILGMFGSI